MAVEAARQQRDAARDQVVNAFVAAWNSSDEAERWRLLEQCWSADGVFLHPSGVYDGREALAAYHVGPRTLAKREPRANQSRRGASRLVALQLGDPPTGWLPFGRGRHVAERAPDGLLRQMITFSIPLPQRGG